MLFIIFEICFMSNINLSLVGNTTSIQNNLNTIWNNIRLTIPNGLNNDGFIVSDIGESVKDVINNAINSAITNWFTNNAPNKNKLIVVCKPSTQWIIYLSNDDNNTPYVVNLSDGKLYGLTDSNTMTSDPIDLTTNEELNEFMQGFTYDTSTNIATYQGQIIGWYQIDENDKLILNGTTDNQRTCHISTVMANMFLINQSA